MRSKPFQELPRYRRLLWQMTLRDLKSRYAGSLAGAFWTLLNPLLLLAVFSFIGVTVLKVRFGARPEPAVNVLYILCGVLPWIAFQEGLARSATSLLENKNLVTRALFPLSVLPAYPVISALISQAAGMLVVLILAGVLVGVPGPSLLLLPVLFGLQLVFSLGLALMVSAFSVFLRDVVHVLPALLLVWMFATPIFYQGESLPEPYREVILLNPLTILVAAYRSVFLEGAWPGWAELGLLSVLAAASLLAGAFLFRRLSAGLADRL